MLVDTPTGAQVPLAVLGAQALARDQQRVQPAANVGQRRVQIVRDVADQLPALAVTVFELMDLLLHPPLQRSRVVAQAVDLIAFEMRRVALA